MSNMLTPYELDLIRIDLLDSLGAGEGQEAESTCLITRLTSATAGTLNPVTLQYDDPMIPGGEPVYTGPCFFSPMVHRRDRQEEAGQTNQRIRQYAARVPWDAGDIHVGDDFTVLTCSDPFAIGKTWTVTDVRYTSLEAERILTLTDTSRQTDDCHVGS